MNGNDILPYLDAILGFCRRRISDPNDAEDLASEIVCHILAGLQRYHIQSLNAWVWRIAHNRYARYIDRRAKNPEFLTEEALYDLEDDYCALDEEEIAANHQAIFRCLHTLSASYRDIFVDYYVGQLSVRALSQKYSLPESTIKWRLNAGRQKIRERIEEKRMERIYKRLNWDTHTCNGNMNPHRYLQSQAARAICEAIYEEALNVEEISLRTGLPTLFVEDELTRLEYGDAVVRIGNKYATNFIILHLCDQSAAEAAITPLMEKILPCVSAAMEKIGDLSAQQYGHILVHYALRKKMEAAKNRILPTSPYPPRKDGGYGWYIVRQTPDECENDGFFSAGCNIDGDENGHLYFYWLDPSFNDKIYRCLVKERLPWRYPDGLIPADQMEDDLTADLLDLGLVQKEENAYRLNVPHFTPAEFTELTSAFALNDGEWESLLEQLLTVLRKTFQTFVPRRLENQIDQWVRCYAADLNGRILHTLTDRGILPPHDQDKPLKEGIFFISGEMLDV